MAAARRITATGITAIELLVQRQHEDWIHAWDDQGKLRSELTAQSIAVAAQRLRDWLVQQDWSEGNADPASAPLQQFAPVSTPAPPDHADHLISRPVTLLAISDPAQFLIWFSAASSLGYPLFLGNPSWGLNHWRQVQGGLTPHLVITDLDWQIPPDFPWRNQAVDNSAFLWEKQDFPQVLIACGKRIDPNDHQGLSHLSPRLRFPQPVESHWIGIPTGGSSGQLRFALHRWSSFTASVSGLQQSDLTDDTGVVNSFCTLPLYHVSGLMQFLRSLLSGGKLRLVPWSLVKANFHLQKLSSIDNQIEAASSGLAVLSDLDQFFLSLVPTQLQHLLEEPSGKQLLVRFYTIFLGGAPAWPALLEQAKTASIRLAPTYGMTETASQVITLHPDDFLRGRLGCGKLLPHARVDWLSSPVQAHKNLPILRQSEGKTDASGMLRIRSHSLAWGYYSIEPRENRQSQAPLANSWADYSGKLEWWPGQDGLGETARSLVTDDLGYCDPDGYFYIIGRASDKIISGGENVFPAAVEAAIRATGLVKDAVVLGLADATWGERVVAVVVLGEASALAESAEAEPLAMPSPSQFQAAWTERLLEAIASTLSPAQRPKQWLFTDAILRNAQGKIQRQHLRDWAIAQGPGD